MLNAMKEGGVSECAEGSVLDLRSMMMMMLIREKPVLEMILVRKSGIGVEQAMCSDGIAV